MLHGNPIVEREVDERKRLGDAGAVYQHVAAAVVGRHAGERRLDRAGSADIQLQCCRRHACVAKALAVFSASWLTSETSTVMASRATPSARAAPVTTATLACFQTTLCSPGSGIFCWNGRSQSGRISVGRADTGIRNLHNRASNASRKVILIHQRFARDATPVDFDRHLPWRNFPSSCTTPGLVRLTLDSNCARSKRATVLCSKPLRSGFPFVRAIFASDEEVSNSMQTRSGGCPALIRRTRSTSS